MKLNLIIILLNVFFFTLFKILPFLIGLAFLTVGERKLLGSIQRREGPTTVGWLGLLQPLADGLKLFVKGLTVPLKSNSTLFIVAPIVMFGCTLVILSIIPFSNELSYFHLRYSLL